MLYILQRLRLSRPTVGVTGRDTGTCGGHNSHFVYIPHLTQVTAQYSTLQHSTVQCSAVHYRTVHYSIESLEQCSIVYWVVHHMSCGFEYHPSAVSPETPCQTPAPCARQTSDWSPIPLPLLPPHQPEIVVFANDGRPLSSITPSKQTNVYCRSL